MGKRKFINPDESESEYEWEESSSKVSKSETSCNDLDNFLQSYTTNSLSQIRAEKKENEKKELERKYEEKLFKAEKPVAPKFDKAWLKKSYFRCLEQAKESGSSVRTLLEDRYDSNTVKFILDNFGSHNNNCYRHTKSFQPEAQYSATEKLQDNRIVEERYVTKADINEASAALIKAEMGGSRIKIEKMQNKLKTLRTAIEKNLKVRLTRPQKIEETGNKQEFLQKPAKNGKMVPYMYLGDSFVSTKSVDDMMMRERATDTDDYNRMFVRMAGKINKNDADSADAEYNDDFQRKHKKEKQIEEREKRIAVNVHKRHKVQVANCSLCLTKLPKHLILAQGEYFCMIVPTTCAISDFHCCLVPIEHIASGTRLGDEAYDELRNIKTRIVEFFDKELNSETLFMETVTGLNKYPHMVLHCVPLTCTRDSYGVSHSVFFKKAIDEAKSEWCQNKKLLNIKDGDIRRTVPKEFPYFSVEFDLGGGYAFVIDDESRFSPYFGFEIVAGVLEKDILDVRRKNMTEFHEQARAVLQFEKVWKKYNLWTHCDTDSD